MAVHGLSTEIEQARKMLAAARLLAPPPATAVDLGCCDGGYTLTFAEAGYATTGIDARQASIDGCPEVDGARFVCDDVRNLAHYGSFDVAICSGVLYHLDWPVKFLETLGRCTERLLCLDTHYAAPTPPPGYRLGPFTRHEGRRGRWYPEVVGERLSSWDNERSFWLDRDELVDVLHGVGFGVVLEHVGAADAGLWRTQLLGVKA